MWRDRAGGRKATQGGPPVLHINAPCTQVQENVMRGGQPGRSAQGRRLHTRPVGSIDRGVSLNRALWVLAEEMRRIRDRKSVV